MLVPPGAVFQGVQRSTHSAHPVLITLDHCTSDLLHGTFTIENLTPQLGSKITTYFEGEIVGPHYSLETGKWGASSSHDAAHWQRLSEVSSLAPTMRSGELGGGHERAPVLMRWKELSILAASSSAGSIVPYENVDEGIPGASFAGTSRITAYRVGPATLCAK